MGRTWMRLRSDRRGQALAEYALIIAFVAVVCIVALIWMSGGVRTVFETINDGTADPVAESPAPESS